MFSAVKTEHLGSGIALLFWLDIGDFLHSKGFRVFYGRSSNIKSYNLMVNNGGHGTAKVKILHNGTHLTLSFMKWPLNPIYFVQHIVDKLKRK
jgi:hypothetical protein